MASLIVPSINQSHGYLKGIERYILLRILMALSRHMESRMLTSCQFSMTTLDKATSSSSEAVADSMPPKFLHIFCGKCTADIGLFSSRIGSITLFKWQVTCSTIVPTSKAPSGPECLAATLVANISRSGCSKSVISPHASATEQANLEPLYLWVLNPNVVYTSTSIPGKRIAMKVLYKDISVEESNRLLDSIVSDVQDLNLPLATIHMSRETLQLSNRLLPGKERFFKDWQVGLLDRWDEDR